MKPALLVVDVQNLFFEISPATAQSLDDAIETINEAIALFRQHELPVICVQHLHPESNLKPGEHDFAVPEKIALLPSDERIHKTYQNAFNKTGLLEKLQAHDVDTVIVTGFCAEHCVLSTYRGAEDLDLKAILLRDALASDELAHIQMVENISDIISFGALRHLLQ